MKKYSDTAHYHPGVFSVLKLLYNVYFIAYRTQSTISSWYRKNMIPTIPSLEKICDAFGITLSQLFAEEDSPVSLTASQKRLLESWAKLTDDQQAAIFTLIDKM